MKRKGFTLIELLVVISIIGILAGLTLSSFSGAQKQARDTTRKSDLNQYRIALETYASANNQKYPGFATDEGIVNANDSLYPKLSNYMSSSLDDPKDTDPYIYRYRENGTVAAGATQYVLYTGLETSGGLEYWVICSNGKVGKAAAEPATSTCPALL